jgi:hypothetical protein
MRNKRILILVLLSILIISVIYGGFWFFYADKNFVYLTWSDIDTSTTINVNYHTKTEIMGVTQVRYDSVSRNGNPARYRFSSQGKKRTLLGIERNFHSVQLTNLTPGKPYYFIVGNNEDGYSREYQIYYVAVYNRMTTVGS